MYEAWFSFAVVIVVQFLFLIVHASFVRERERIPEYLKKGMMLGISFGIVFDLIVGKYIGIFEYHLGFDLLFLVINGALSYGFMMANVLLLHSHSVRHMFLWSVALGVVYEVSNYFFPVWEWTFASSVVEYAVVIFVAYFALAWLMMLTLRLAYKTRFLLVPF